MNKCSVCKKKTERESYDMSKPIFCFDCDPKNKCVLCGEPRMKPIGHSEYCNSCFETKQKEKKATESSFKIIDNTKYGGTEMNEAHYKNLNTRCVDDSGTSLSGEAGLEYMKSKGDTYTARLADYYK